MGYCTEEQARVIIEHFDKQDQWRKDQMPTEQEAINVLFEAYRRLKEFGWREIIYHPGEGVEFEVIEPGSTGIFKCVFQKTPTRGSFWIQEDGGSPSHPVLFRERHPCGCVKKFIGVCEHGNGRPSPNVTALRRSAEGQ